MILEKTRDMKLKNEDDRSMKIFEKTKYRDRQRDIADSILNSDDTNMKIYAKNSLSWSNGDRFVS